MHGNKTEDLKRHARKRFAQRFPDMHYNAQIAKDIVWQIQNRKCELVERQSCRVHKYKVNHQGHTFIAVYDKIRKVIITVLTMEMYENDQRMKI